VEQNKEIINDLNYVGSSLSILFLPSDLESVKLLVLCSTIFLYMFQKKKYVILCGEIKTNKMQLI